MDQKCAHCGEPASIKITEGNRVYYHCLSCDERVSQIEAREFAQNVSLLNFLHAQMDQITGLGPSPRFQIPSSPPVSYGNVNVGNVHVENSNVGVINTGAIKSIANAVGVLNRQGADDIATAIRELVLAMHHDPTLDDERRNQVLDVLSTIAEQASAPTEERRLGTVRACLKEIATLAGGAAGLAQLWELYGPTVSRFFGIT